MQTLGLASEQKPTDGLLKRLFWPTIENPYDVDLLQRQGFWICTFVALLSAVTLMATGPLWFGLLVAAVYLLAGMGVREGSVGAATVIFLCYLCDRISAIEGAVFGFGGGSPLVGVFILALLLSNIRATLLMRRWQQAAGDPAEAQNAERSAGTFPEKLVNAVPAAVWPKGQYIFFPLGVALLALSVLGMVMLPGMQRRKAAQRQRQQQKMQMEFSSPPQ